MPESTNRPQHFRESGENCPPPTHRPVPRLSNGLQRPQEVERELRQWYKMSDADRRTSLRKAARTGTGYRCESLVHFCRYANSIGDRDLWNLGFEALSRTATRILLPKTGGITRADRDDRMQDVILEVLRAIRNGRADFLECSFRTFCKRRFIDAYREADRKYESKYNRIQPVDESDPLERIAHWGLDPERRAMLTLALQRLPAKTHNALIQYFILGLKQKEIAKRHGVSDRTVRTWIAKARISETGKEEHEHRQFENQA